LLVYFVLLELFYSVWKLVSRCIDIRRCSLCFVTTAPRSMCLCRWLAAVNQSITRSLDQYMIVIAHVRLRWNAKSSAVKSYVGSWHWVCLVVFVDVQSVSEPIRAETKPLGASRG